MPVVGVMPYSDIDIEDGGSLTDRFKNSKENKGIKISVIKLKHISNFADIDALSIQDDVTINYVTSADELGNEDMIVIPVLKTLLMI